MGGKYLIDFNDYIYWKDIKVFRIVALKSFRDVVEGSKGGYVENYSNLSQEGLSWIYDNAIVYDQANISGNAIIAHRAVVNKEAKVLENAKVFENALITNRAIIFDQASIHGNVRIGEDRNIGDMKNVFGKEISDNSILIKNTKFLYI